jgi:hypothetical protein
MRSKVWKPLDLACLKWSCIFFGMIAGAWLSDFTRRYGWAFAAAAILLGIKAADSYFRDDPARPQPPSRPRKPGDLK